MSEDELQRRELMAMKRISRRAFLRLCAVTTGAIAAACAPAAPTAVEKPVAAEKEVVEKELSKEITECARDGDVDGVRSLIDQGTDVNAQDKKGMTALLYAAREGHTEVAELLISEGADLTAAEPGAQLTALHFCALRGHRGIAEARGRARDLEATVADLLTELETEPDSR